MGKRLEVLVYLRESDEQYHCRLVNSDAVHYTFCESEAAVHQSIANADIILGSISFPVHLLSSAKCLSWIQVTGAGVDAFLSKAELPDDVALTRADLAFGEQIAEYVLGHLLAVTQQLRDVYHLQETRTWNPLIVEFLKGQTMGIAGVGSIGEAIADRARSMGMRTHGLVRTKREIPGFDTVHEIAHLSEFLTPLDVLVVCLPLTEQTRGLIGARQLALLKTSAILVNISRGSIVNEEALIDALQQHRLRAAILDVFEQEPLPAENPLWSLDNVTITSHHSGLNIPDDMIEFFLDNLNRFLSDQPLNGRVDISRGY